MLVYAGCEGAGSFAGGWSSLAYTIINSDELKKALNNMRNDIGEGKYINLPKWVSIKKACINIKNQDDKCFQYAIQCGYHKIYEKSHPGILDHYKRIEDG